MSQAYKIHKQEVPYFLTLQVVSWVDVFTRKCYRDILVNSLNYCVKDKSLSIYAYVIMSNHVHLLASADKKNLSSILGSFKAHTSKKIIECIYNEKESRREWMLDLFTQARLKHKRNSNYQVWTHENHAEECFSPSFTSRKINYIHDNPVRAGLVASAEEYLYSSATTYFGRKGLVPVEIIHPHLAFS